MGPNSIPVVIRLAHGMAVMCGIGLGICKLAAVASIDPVGRVRQAVNQMKRDTVPTDGRIVYRELIGYFPLPPSAVWEVETNESWLAYEHRIRKQFDAWFTVVASPDGGLACVSHMGGEVQHLHIDVVGQKPLRVRCSLSVAPDLADL
jgi:hypothetical protein